MSDKKVTLRETVRADLAQMILREFGLSELPRTKEGLLLQEDEADVVIKVIQKKDRVENQDIVEVIVPADEPDEFVEAIVPADEPDEFVEAIRESVVGG